MKKFLLTCLATLFAFTTWAYSFSDDSTGSTIYYNFIGNSSTVEVTYVKITPAGCDTYVGHVVIPSTVTYDGETYDVVSIGYAAFCYCNQLTEVTIPESVTTIGDYAFEQSGITGITIPKTVTTIGEEEGTVFEGCEGLTEVTIPAYVTTLLYSAFENCTNLTKVTFEGNLLTIFQEGIFERCSKLKEVNIPSSVTTIESSVFYVCSSLEEIELPALVTSIGNNAFASCTALSSITSRNPEAPKLSSSTFNNVDKTTCVVYVPYGSGEAYSEASYWSAFENIEELPYVEPTLGDGDKFEYDDIWYQIVSFDDKTVEVTWGGETQESGTPIYTGEKEIPAMATHGDDVFHVIGIGEYAFANCGGLQTIEFLSNDNMGSIDQYAFYGCAGLEDITFPNTVITIGDYAFAECSSLKTVTISDTAISDAVKELGVYAFSGCTNLEDFYVLNPFPPTCDATTFGDESSSSTIYSSCTLHVQEGLSKYYRVADVWKDFNNIEEIEIAHTNGFKCGDFYYVINSPTQRTAYVTYGGETYDSGTPCYQGELVIPSEMEVDGITYTVTGIDNSAFRNCRLLTGITIPTTITYISHYAFEYCTSLKELKIPDSVTSFGSYLCGWCDSLEKVEISNHISTLNEFAFYQCENLKEVTLGNSVTYLAHQAFNGCTSLTNIEIPSSVKEVGTMVFFESGLQEITFPASITEEMGTGVCQNCYDLEKAVINSIDLGGNMFSGCRNLTDVTLGNTVEYMGAGAFQNCAFEHITIPESVTSTETSVFNGCANLKEITIPNSFESIADWLVQNCTSLQSATISKSVKSIGNYAFRYDSSLAELYCFNPEPPECGEGVFYDVDTETCVLYVPAGSRGLYAEADQWQDFIHIVEVAYVETSEAEDVTVSSAILKGKVAGGDTPISTQGFEFWKDGLDNVITTIGIEESEMSYTITNLDPETTYIYRAFATTEDGTTYGEDVSFTTKEDTSTGIDNVEMGGINGENVEGIYSTSGQKLNTTQKGVNIIRYTDGTTKKVLVK